MLRARIVAMLIFASVVVCFSWLATREESTSPLVLPSLEEQKEIFRYLVQRESLIRKRAEQKFPGDHWSQSDDFHNAETALVRQLAAQSKQSQQGIWFAIDRGIRQHWFAQYPREVSNPPCKPRPFYD
ncbi:MAG: hypothetical protein IPJ88_18085 [Myxococcales bacterium]|nr:MAG: hypothetical protein IPJ88_18085 [Myxococcales bacterium]